MSWGDRATACGKKRRFDTYEAAAAHLAATRARVANYRWRRGSVYRCDHCGGFHHGRGDRWRRDDDEDVAYKTRRAECRGCRRYLAIKNKGQQLCVTCWRRARRDGVAAVVAPPAAAPLAADAWAFLLGLWRRLVRYGRRIGYGWGLRGSHLDDCGSDAVLGAALAVARGDVRYEPFVFTRARDYLLRRFQAGDYPIRWRANKPGWRRRLRGRERLFSDVLARRGGDAGFGDVELYGRVVA